MRKRIFVSIILAVALISGFCFAANAEARTSIGAPVLSFSGNTAQCSVRIIENGKISATLELWQGNTLIDSWEGSGTSYLSISGSHTVTSGKTYTAKVSGTANGVEFTGTSESKVCP
ncbi:MAG: hypothetical protein LUD55_06235 [Oscillospiraceae bacterium]|nr:hypothetical protein [Oscillospiraceae bacterium]